MGNAAVTLLLLLCLICWNLLPIDSELWTVAYKCTADVREMLSDWKSVGNRLENFQCSMGHSFPEIEKEKTIPPCLPWRGDCAALKIRYLLTVKVILWQSRFLPYDSWKNTTGEDGQEPPYYCHGTEERTAPGTCTGSIFQWGINGAVYLETGRERYGTFPVFGKQKTNRERRCLLGKRTLAFEKTKTKQI